MDRKSTWKLEFQSIDRHINDLNAFVDVSIKNVFSTLCHIVLSYFRKVYVIAVKI